MLGCIHHHRRFCPVPGAVGMFRRRRLIRLVIHPVMGMFFFHGMCIIRGRRAVPGGF